MSGRQTELRYLMDPAEDTILYGDEITEGMWVLPEDPALRREHSHSEDERLRGQRFRRVTRLRRQPQHVSFIGEWVDGYKESVTHVHADLAWIVKKSSLPGAEPEAGSEEER